MTGKPVRLCLLRTLVAFCAILVLANPVSLAEPFPGSGVIRIIAPSSVGAPPDVVSRLLAAEFNEFESWRTIVENKPGAMQSVAMAETLGQPADGRTIFPLSLGAITTPALMPEKGLRLQRDFAPVVKVAKGYNVLVVHPSFPAVSLKELIALLKASPGKFTYSSAGFGVPSHLLAEMLKLETSTSFVAAQYPGRQAQRVSDLLSGVTDFGFFNSPAVSELVATGKLRALAITSPNRIAAFKDVPSVVEEGYPELVSEDWIGFVVKAGTPDELIERLNAAVNRALARPKVRDALATLGYEVVGGTPAELGAFVDQQATYWANLVRQNNITVPK